MCGMHNREATAALERDLREIFGQRLRSLIAYSVHMSQGFDAPSDTEHHGSHTRERLTHTMAVVDAITPDDLRACAGRAARWHAKRTATPLIFATRELERSLDVFPFELGGILANHVVLYGPDPFDGLRVDPADLRRGCEIQARSHLLHLREGFIETEGNGDALAMLVVQSAPPFAALLTNVARLQGLSSDDPEAAGRHVERLLSLTSGTMTDVVKLAEATEISSAEANRIFRAYLEAVERLVTFVDQWKSA